MKLLTAADRRSLPPLYSQEDKGWDAIVRVKFFTPTSSWTWYAVEFDGEDTFFGYADDGCGGGELGLGPRLAAQIRVYEPCSVNL